MVLAESSVRMATVDAAVMITQAPKDRAVSFAS